MLNIKQKLNEWFDPGTWLVYLTAILVGIGFIMVYSSSAMKEPYERKAKLLNSVTKPIKKPVSKNIVKKNNNLTISYKTKEYHDEKKIQEVREAVFRDNEFHNMYYLKKQFLFGVFGFIMLLVIYYFIPYEDLKQYSKPLFLFSILLLILVYLPVIGYKSHGSARWINLGIVKFQSSELAKLSVIILMATYLENNKRKITDFKHGFLPLIILTGIPCALIFFERDLGCTIILGSIIFAMCMIGRVKNTHLLAMFAAGVIVFLLSILFNDYQGDRFGDNEHVKQSLIAVGSGGIFGFGLGNGISKYNFLGEAHCDFIFSVICQEFGFVGGIVVVTLYLLWIFQGIRIAMNAKTYFAALLASGITLMIAFPAFVNIFSSLKLCPTKGLVLPFISYGGSSILICLTATGILLSIAKNREKTDIENRMVFWKQKILKR